MTSLGKLTIETPEQTQLEFALAGVGSRFLALAVDSLIQVVSLLFLLVVGLTLSSANLVAWPEAGTWAWAVLVILFFLITHAYYAFFEAVWNGQTPGKQYTGLRVIKESGRPITAYEAIGRNVVRIIDQVPGIYAIGILTMLLNRQNKRLGDFVAGTVVVHEKSLQEMKIGWELDENPTAALHSSVQLSVEEWHLVDTFLHRRAHLEESARQQLASQIADRIAARLNLTPEKRGPAERFLEEVARKRPSY